MNCDICVHRVALPGFEDEGRRDGHAALPPRRDAHGHDHSHGHGHDHAHPNAGQHGYLPAHAPLMPLVLVIGGTRSGKSATGRAARRGATGRDRHYVATGDGAATPRWRERIAAHRARRPGVVADGRDARPGRAVAGRRDGRHGRWSTRSGRWLAALMPRHGLLTTGRWPRSARAGDAAPRSRARPRARRLPPWPPGARRSPWSWPRRRASARSPPGAATRRYLDLAGARPSQVLLRPPPRAVGCSRASRAAPLVLDARARRRPSTRPVAPHGDAMVPPGGGGLRGQRGRRAAARRGCERALAGALERPGAYPDEPRRRPGGRARATAARPTRSSLTNGAAEALLAAGRGAAPAPRGLRAPLLHRARGRPARPRPRRSRTPSARRTSFALRPRRRARRAPTWSSPPTRTTRPAGSTRPTVVDALARPGRALVVDEAFMDFVPGRGREPGRPRDDVPGPGRGPQPDQAVVARRRAGRLPARARAGSPTRCGACGRPGTRTRSRSPPLRACAAAPTQARERAPSGSRRRDRTSRAGLGELPRRADLAVGRELRARPRARRTSGSTASCCERGLAVRPARTFPGLGPDHLRITVRASGGQPPPRAGARRGPAASAPRSREAGPGPPAPPRTRAPPPSRRGLALLRPPCASSLTR